MTDQTKTADNPVGYRVTCRAVPSDRFGPCILINQTGTKSTDLGYSIWSREELERILNEMKLAGAVAWPI